MSVAKTSARRATLSPQLLQCTKTAVHALKEDDPAARIHFWNWFLQSCAQWRKSILSVSIGWGLVFLTFAVNFQNSPYWSAKNRGIIHELWLHDDKIGVSCAIRAWSVTGSIFCDGTVYAVRYANNILRPFSPKRTKEKSYTGFLARFCNKSYRGADKSLVWPTSRGILFDGKNISFHVSLFIHINSILYLSFRASQVYNI